MECPNYKGKVLDCPTCGSLKMLDIGPWEALNINLPEVCQLCCDLPTEVDCSLPSHNGIWAAVCTYCARKSGAMLGLGAGQMIRREGQPMQFRK